MHEQQQTDEILTKLALDIRYCSPVDNQGADEEMDVDVDNGCTYIDHFEVLAGLSNVDTSANYERKNEPASLRVHLCLRIGLNIRNRREYKPRQTLHEIHQRGFGATQQKQVKLENYFGRKAPHQQSYLLVISLRRMPPLYSQQIEQWP